MPTKAQILLPIPVNGKEFEVITKEYCQIVYGHAELFGREGQSQHGIDIYCNSRDGFIGVQCKCYKTLTISIVDEIIAKAKEFPEKLHTLIIATTAPRDTKVQKHVIAKSQESEQEVRLLYWDTISNLLRQSPDILKLHYPDDYCIFYSDTNITVPYIQNEFNQAVQHFKVIDFVRTDIGYGVQRCLPAYIAEFCHEMNSLLERAILLQDTDIYTSIKSFSYKLQEYNTFLSRIMNPSGSFYTIQGERLLHDLKPLEQQDLSFKTEIDDFYCKINNGLSLFR